MRGQAYTLESVIAAVLIVTSLVFALQVTAVTPLSASTSNQHIENQQRASAAGVLTAAEEAGVLKDAVLYWNDTAAEFDEAERRIYYTNGEPPNEFGNITDRSFGGRGLAVNVVLYPGGDNGPVPMVYRGEPSDNAVSASRTVVLFDDDNLTAPGHESTTVKNAATYGEYIPEDTGNSGSVYNVVRVEVVVWRM
ncbi:hypothetical protein GJ631_11750 [Natronomonas sp. CBA1123]|jgi:hypothetical protein|uniref:DUF7288 family protein n=1 Tax=Natronomonas sp. CBA1123 TaxID=2668070 RepID=UPI0012EA725F|nr:hypothetical protein [Natronomonas sp. CBA1123]MUV87219.1 hypothetical protein [Natronomonas sp. CBA1123]